MPSRLSLSNTELEGLVVLTRAAAGDSRGQFERLFCTKELTELLGGRSIVQINRSFTSAAGTVRGMHLQYPPAAEMKFVSCTRGEVFDVAVDLRRGSKTFLKWHAQRLSPGTHTTLVIPEGFAHGFQTLTDDCEMLYLHTAPFTPESESGINPFDPRLAVCWPLEVTEISDRDSQLATVTDEFLGVLL